MELDSNSLSELLRKERALPGLQEVPKELYEQLKLLLETSKKTYPEFSRERENIERLVSDIYTSREKKLVLFAVSFSRSGEEVDVENTTHEENDFLNELVGILKKRRLNFTSGQNTKSKPKNKKTKEEKTDVKPEKIQENVDVEGRSSTISLRILEDLPPVVGADGKTYGAFSAEDVVSLPERNAKVFLKNGWGEEINLSL